MLRGTREGSVADRQIQGPRRERSSPGTENWVSGGEATKATCARRVATEARAGGEGTSGGQRTGSLRWRALSSAECWRVDVRGEATRDELG